MRLGLGVQRASCSLLLPAVVVAAGGSREEVVECGSVFSGE